MAEIQSIHPADLRTIENNLKSIHKDLDIIHGNVNTVDKNVRVVYDEIGKLAQEFHDYVEVAEMQHNLVVAETRLVKIRQQLENKYGHYAEVRRTTTGILQADDLGIVKKDTISTATEELMLSTPDYWLTPCLVALSAWICDQPALAEKALREGIKRNDEKTSLLFALICRRADRKQACLKWTQRYLAGQNEQQLDRKCIIILDAFASGLLGADSEGIISRQMMDWLARLASEAGFVERQTKQWSDAINLKRRQIDTSSYVYLRKYSKTWPILQDILEGANLHAQIINYFEGIFNKEASTAGLKVQLDDILSSLVTDFDDEELPLRKEEKLNQLIVDYQGDLSRANASMTVEESAFETYKDFTQLLTDAAMKPDTSHASAATQKFAIALSKEWITDAYNDVCADNRMKIPNEILINIDTFNEKTTDGQNEPELVEKFDALIDREKESSLAQCKLGTFEKYCLIGGAAVIVIGLLMIMFGSGGLGLIAGIAGIGMIIKHYSAKKNMDAKRLNIEQTFDEKRTNGKQILLALLAEIVDYRIEFTQKDSESTKVLDFLEGITPEQYVKKLSNTTRRIKTAQ